MNIPNKWRAHAHFAAFAAWGFNVRLAWFFGHPTMAFVSLLFALGFLLLGVLTIRKPDDPDEPKPPRGIGGRGFAAA